MNDPIHAPGSEVVTLKTEKEGSDEDITSSIKRLEDSLGELYLSLCYLKPSEKNPPPWSSEEVEGDELDKSLENLDEKMNQGDNNLNDRNPLDKNHVSSQKCEKPKSKSPETEEDEVREINPVNKEVMRLSLRLNGNRPGTPTGRLPTPSVHSDADSGIGTATPTKRISDGNSIWTRSNFDHCDDSPGSPGNLRNTPTLRSNRSYNFESDAFIRNTSSLKSNRSYDMENYILNRLTSPTSEFRNFDVASLKSLTIPMGSTDGRKIIKRSETSPEELLNLPAKPFDDEYSSGSFQRSPGGSYDDFRFPRRAQWANKAQFILACVGYSVGLGNIWRFPYVCYKSGGGAFLVPYFLTLVVCGIPLLYMELTIGQLTRRGPIGALGKLCPLLKGAGLSSVIISFIMSTYYNVIIAYTLYYFFSSFKSNAPWEHCDNIWNTPDCWMPSRLMQFNITRPNMSRTPSQEFYDHKVLQVTSGIEILGKFRWELAACLIVAWILVYFSIWKSVKSSGKVVYFTATFPYLVIFAFLVRSLTLEGADVGLKYLFKPRWELLGDAKVWINAAGQVFNSIGLAFGSIISFASYNKPNNKILVDTLSVSFINAITSLMIAIFAFATIGNIATEHHTSVMDVITDGPGLVFVVYPQAMAKMPGAQSWSILFFFMLLCLGLNSQFAIVDVVVTTIQDGFPNWMRRNFVCHEVLVFVVCLISFVAGIPHIFQNGIFFFQLIDHFTASISIMYLSFFELIAISWFYGFYRLQKNIRDLTGETPSIYFRFCWCIAAPAFIMSVWIFSLIDYEPPTYRNGAYKYPAWAEALGWMIASMSLFCIPAYAFYVCLSSEGKTIKEKLKNAVTPRLEICDFCEEYKCEHLSREADRTRELDTLLKERELPKIVPAVAINGS